ncbi:DUF2807 domain-containing protein [Flavobacterium sp. j3]|uniref:DUF2807 domain-containing protein n=1 Tax=Flavobacterium aureirubrum TaxID=3133147 RepID=A0ABU9N457_9FLAO
MTKLIIAIVFTLTSIFANAQLKGTGKTVTKTYDYKTFDKLSFEGLNDDIQVEIGTSFKVEITMKETNEKNIQFVYDEKETELSLKVKAKTGKELYDERDTYQIKITMPEISVLKNFGNSDINVKGIIGRYFRAETSGNGSIICQGTIDQLDIEKVGNGDINAKKLIAKNAKIKNIGNGNVLVNVSENLEGNLVGNGDIQNIGKAQFSAKSTKKGNGNLIVD